MTLLHRKDFTVESQIGQEAGRSIIQLVNVKDNKGGPGLSFYNIWDDK